jgi:hypothetical protein
MDGRPGIPAEDPDGRQRVDTLAALPGAPMAVNG